MIQDPSMMAQEPAQAGFLTPKVDPMYLDRAEKKRSPLSKFIDSDNIAEDLDADQLMKIGMRCADGYDVDEASRKEWMRQTTDAISLASQVKEEKTWPWPDAANIKLPLITDATIKFAARAYSEIIRENKVVKAHVVGDDPTGAKADRASRVSDYMSWQLMERETEWEADTDKLLHSLPLVGHLFRKRYYCTTEKRTKSELCLPDKICINQQASSLESARRITHIIDNVSNNDVVSNKRSGIWLDVDFKEAKENSLEQDLVEDDDYFTFLEQCCWLDLDEDDYEEPYIVTVEKESRKVVRIIANYDENSITENQKGEIVRIAPKQIFTDYMFIPSLDGGYYGIGFGQLMGPLNKTANSLVNQLLDAGTLSNMTAGYLSKEVKVLSGTSSFAPGEFKKTAATAEQLRNGVSLLPTKEPSATLFNLLGLIMDLTKDLSSVKDVMAGDAPGSNVPATTVMALIEQGMKTFNAIYKRIYRSLKKEFKQLYALNYEYSDAEEYFNVLDKQQVVMKQDFEPDTLDIVPVADPNMSSDMQRLARAEALKGAIGMPGVNPRPIMVQWFEALRIPSEQIQEILPEADPNAVPPEVQALMKEVEFKQAEIQVKEQQNDIKSRELDLKERELEYKALEAVSKAVKNFADAESVEPGQQMQIYKALADIVLKEQAMEAKSQSAIPQQP